jgi:hypothetical protein
VDEGGESGPLVVVGAGVPGAKVGAAHELLMLLVGAADATGPYDVDVKAAVPTVTARTAKLV